ncbi:uroporphyrinogen-III C-methyltransferase [Alteromonas flava]|uniref:uroporphyrinogen-III C-methyltransferase n=1 Tax=Alteromonas flava TaxID=2048003 RepID=UPI000C294C72|nr:uroporphyrinogen-III C-methyltransferase [Alteromonas flava]
MFNSLKMPFLRDVFGRNKGFYKSNRLALEPVKASSYGKVYLIGAGSGDAELLTLKAYRTLQHADIIMVDWLVDSAIYEYFPACAQRIFVGKKCGRHSMTQAEICSLMVQQALLGKTVVRLKGGDPSIFGRIAEETLMLRQHDIPFAIIPGVTAASGCAAYAGIPLTHRDCAHAVRFVTAHKQDPQAEINWQELAKTDDTLVFYMGLNRITHITEQLQLHGMPGSTPIAVVDQGTLIQQRICCKTLDSLTAQTDLVTFNGPALIIVGEVVNKREPVELGLLSFDMALT